MSAQPPISQKLPSRKPINSWQPSPQNISTKHSSTTAADIYAKPPLPKSKIRSSLDLTKAKQRVPLKKKYVQEESENYPYDADQDVHVRAMRKLSRPPRPASLAAELQNTPPIETETETTAYRYERRFRRPSASSTSTIGSDSEPDTFRPDPNDPSSIYKLKHSPEVLERQIRVLDTIAQLKKQIRDTTTENDKLDAEYAYAKYIVENLRHLESGQSALLTESLSLLKSLSAKGHESSQFTFASLLITGVPGSSKRHTPDYRKAFPLYLSAAKKGHPDSLYHVALCYEHGRGTLSPPDFNNAVKKYRKAAIMHHPGAMYRLALVLMHGELGQVVNTTSAIKWLRLSAQYATEKYPSAVYHLALVHKHSPHLLPEKSGENAESFLDLLGRGTQLGHVPSLLALAHHHHTRNQKHVALEYLTQAAQKQSPEALYVLSTYHHLGLPSLPSNPQTAYTLSRRSASLGHPLSQYAVGYYTEYGIGMDSDVDEALEWYTLAARNEVEVAVKRLKGEEAVWPGEEKLVEEVLGSVEKDAIEGGSEVVRRGLDKLVTVRTWKKLRSLVVERRGLRKAGGL